MKEGYRLGDDIQSKVLAFAFGLSAEIERQLISQRTTEALRRKKAEGVKLGRPKGSAPAVQKLEAESQTIQQLLTAGTPKAEIARRYHVSRKTLYNWLKEGGNG